MLPRMQDAAVGAAVRLLRRRLRMRQLDVARAARVSQSTISRLEAGNLDVLSLGTICAICRTVGARFEADVRWRGGTIDRVLDERHAALVAAITAALRTAGWEALAEVTYSRYGERGSIDVLGTSGETVAAVVIEVKSRIMSVEDTARTHDAKVRLAPAIVEERLGWRPRLVGRILVIDDTTANRARLRDQAHVLRQLMPNGNIEIRRWLKQPAGNLAAIWFVRLTHAGNAKRGAQRVRRSGHAHGRVP